MPATCPLRGLGDVNIVATITSLGGIATGKRHGWPSAATAARSTWTVPPVVRIYGALVLGGGKRLRQRDGRVP